MNGPAMNVQGPAQSASPREQPGPSVAPGAAWVNINRPMQAVFSVRGMWLDGEPRGLLATWLGPRTPWRTSDYVACFWITPEGLQALSRDIETAPGLSGHQRGQFLRRLRESAQKAGLRPPVASGGDAAPSATTRPASAQGTPFDPLVCPPPGRARDAFVKHLHDSLRAVIAYSQESIYEQGGGDE